MSSAPSVGSTSPAANDFSTWSRQHDTGENGSTEEAGAQLGDSPPPSDSATDRLLLDGGYPVGSHETILEAGLIARSSDDAREIVIRHRRMAMFEWLREPDLDPELLRDLALAFRGG